jgi:hypothetical protein
MNKQIILALMFVLLAMVFALIALMFDLYWISYVKKNKTSLLKKVQRKGLFGKTFIHPRVFFEYCLSHDKLDDKKTSFYKIMFLISFMAWFLFFLMGFVVYLVYN